MNHTTLGLRITRKKLLLFLFASIRTLSIDAWYGDGWGGDGGAFATGALTGIAATSIGAAIGSRGSDNQPPSPLEQAQAAQMQQNMIAEQEDRREERKEKQRKREREEERERQREEEEKHAKHLRNPHHDELDDIIEGTDFTALDAPHNISPARELEIKKLELELKLKEKELELESLRSKK